MHRMKSLGIKSLVCLLMLLPALGFARDFKAGVDYTVLDKPVATETGNKIEVLEFFWYGCPHCFKFEPFVSKWKKQLPDNVVFIQVPAPLNPKWMVHTKTYYALELMDQLDKVHEDIFKALHVERKKLFTRDSIADYLATKGIDRKLFVDTYDSFGVEMRARKSMQLMQEYNVTGVPMLAVNGKYIITASQAGSYPAMIEIASYLVDKEAKSSN